MHSIDLLHLEHKIGNKSYILSKNELRCIDSSNSKKNFSILLNRLDPYYSFGGTRSILWVVCIAYMILGVIVRTGQWFFGSPVFNTAGKIQLITFLAFLIYAGYRCYRDLKIKRAFRFNYLYEGNFAFSLPVNKKNKTKTQAFVQAIIARIHDATPCNEYVLFLLGQYNLLTNTEATQLDAYIQHHETDSLTPKENVIQLVN